MKKIISLIVALCIIASIIPAVAPQADAASSLLLNINWDNIKKVGHQNPAGQACTCYAIAYVKTILDGSVHYYSEYNLGTNEFNAIAAYRGVEEKSFSTRLDAYKAIYSEIQAGRPVVANVAGARNTNWHYVTVAGYENFTSTSSLSASNFLMIDPCASEFKLENVGTIGYDLVKANHDSKYHILVDTSGKTVSSSAADQDPASITLTGQNYPSSLDKGQVFSIYGTVKSNYNLSSVTVGVYDRESGGTLKTGRTVSPNKTEYNVHDVDNFVYFNNLELGEYWYRITATSNGTTVTLLNQRFTVKGGGETANTVTFTLESNDGTGETSTLNLLNGDTFTFPTAVNHYPDQLIFLGWSINKDAIISEPAQVLIALETNGLYKAYDTIKVSSDLTLYAVWGVIPVTLTFDANGGTGAPEPIVITKGNTAEIPSGTPQHENPHMHFCGWGRSKVTPFTSWRERPTDPTVIYLHGYGDLSRLTLDSDLTLYAVWYQAPYNTVQYDANGGTGAPAPQEFEWGQNPAEGYITLDEPTRAGYNFLGWAFDKNATEPKVLPGEYWFDIVECTLYAVWKPTETNKVSFPHQTVYFQGQYTDVPANQWYTPSVASAFEYGLMKGDSPTTFTPYGDVTIAEAITMAARIHSIYQTGEENFVMTGEWYQVYLDYAYENGIISRAFYNCDVEQRATRAQFAEIFANALPDEGLYAKNSVADNSIPDVKLTESFAPYVYKLYRAGILAGNDANGTFYPDTYITRAESAAIVSRMAESDNRVSITLG